MPGMYVLGNPTNLAENILTFDDRFPHYETIHIYGCISTTDTGFQQPDPGTQ